MPRFNVEYKGKWACFSTIVDFFITEFMGKQDYEEWRLEEYGRANYEPAEQCNLMTIKEAIKDLKLYHSKKEVIQNLIDAGLELSEVEKFWNKRKVKKCVK